LNVEKFAELSTFITTLFSWTTLFLSRFTSTFSSSSSQTGSKKKKSQTTNENSTTTTDLVSEAGKELALTLKSVAIDLQTLLTTTFKTRTLFSDLLSKSSNRIFDLQVKKKKKN